MDLCFEVPVVMIMSTFGTYHVKLNQKWRIKGYRIDVIQDAVLENFCGDVV
jgi:hypothetical protein